MGPSQRRLQLTPDLEEWEVVFPALWRRESLNATGLSGGNTDPGFGRSAGGGGRGQASGSSREVRSVARAPLEEAAEGQSEPWFASPLHPGAEDEEELESQELPRGSSGDTALSSGAPASWQPPLPPKRPSSPPPAQKEEPSTEEVLLRIPALSRDLYLLLRKDGRFLAQRFAVEQWPKPGPDPTRATADPRPPMPPDASCFYTGTVLRHPGSLASFSTCGGGLGAIDDCRSDHGIVSTDRPNEMSLKLYDMKLELEGMGFIQLNEDFIFIEPFNDTMAIIGHPHRLYRQKRSTEEKVTENSSVHRHHCGVISDKGRPRSKTISETRREKRYSYKLPQEYNIETVVVADPAMISYHGVDAARRFILTILNMVFNLFQHKSLGMQVNLRVIKLILLHETPADLYIGHHGEKMLESFCKWQHEEFGRKNDIHLEMATSWGEEIASVDAAILITRKDFCVHKDEPCDTVGIAYLNGMCSEKRKCIIAEDNGLNLAFTIAHEMGHKSKHVLCTGLWCRVEGEAECKTKLDPPMDGTDCDPGKMLGSEARDCNGPRKQYRICENPPCPAGLPGFRDWQCQAYSVRTSYPKHALQWQAVFDEEKPCALFCSPVGKEQPILLSENVIDGTSCGYQGLDICANGRCQKAGCDGLLGSLAREDHCGICNGNGKSCKVIKGDFNHTRGAALRDASKQSINSDWKIEHSGAFSLAGTTVHYIRRGLWEKISAKGPTTTPLHLLVLLFQDQNYGLHYEYTVPSDPLPDNQSSKEPGPLFMWTHAGWGDCNATCGGGERKTMVSCTKIMSKNISLVDNKKCKDLTKPEPQIRKCNEQPCQTRWMMTDWTTCSRTCGKGVQSRQVACTQQLENGTLIRAWERDCIGPKPATAQRCEGQDCMTVWEAGVWSECSVKCGKGVRHRTVRCTNPRKKCVLSTRPREAEDCEDYSKCYVWRVGDWSKCSITCGKGMQSRVIQCMHKITGRHGNECFSSEKPAAYRPCHLQPCNEKINVNTITSPRLAALTFKCLGDQWPVYCRVIREKNLCQDMRWYQRCCETCRDFYAQKLQQKS
ncbi:A disintegrin and metalloproteinase with thrombospondin motifs 19 [Apodemus speciosus]|uniref:A disintegrin and metalloproteinase with thrombospondin motifs 19 n=1 Tax=Apodemus speciosus TaxID=105296 RepID=A0ABQ0FR90_APOSI